MISCLMNLSILLVKIWAFLNVLAVCAYTGSFILIKVMMYSRIKWRFVYSTPLHNE